MRLILLWLLSVANDKGTRHSMSTGANHDFRMTVLMISAPIPLPQMRPSCNRLRKFTDVQPSLPYKVANSKSDHNCTLVRTADRNRGVFQLLSSLHRLRIFVSSASIAESLRSRCGSVRGAPVCNSQTSPIAAPQVLQGTDNICFVVSSLAFTAA